MLGSGSPLTGKFLDPWAQDGSKGPDNSNLIYEPELLDDSDPAGGSDLPKSLTH